MNRNPVKITPGTELVIDTIVWHDPYWEFDHPSAALRPVFRGFETGKNHEQIVEDLCIDAAVFGRLSSDDFESTWSWRGYSLSNLKRVFRRALNGHNFPRLGYTAKQTHVRFFNDEHGGLTWEEVSENAPV